MDIQKLKIQIFSQNSTKDMVQGNNTRNQYRHLRETGNHQLIISFDTCSSLLTPYIKHLKHRNLVQNSREL